MDGQRKGEEEGQQETEDTGREPHDGSFLVDGTMVAGRASNTFAMPFSSSLRAIFGTSRTFPSAQPRSAASRAALQILEKWNSDCRMRATLPTAALERLAFVAYSGVFEYPPSTKNLSKNPPAFAGYNVEVKATDHPELPGGGLQIGVVREPTVTRLEEWRDDKNAWIEVWAPS